jgi:adenylate cyclase
LAQVRELRVVDPLSCGPLGLRSAQPRVGLQQFKADYVLMLHGRLDNGRLTLAAQLMAAPEASTVLDIACQFPVEEALQPESALLAHVVEQVVRCLLQRSERECARVPLHNLDSHSLMLAGIAGLHGGQRARFSRAREVFEHLVQRHPRLSTPRVWLSHWHVLSITRGEQERSAAMVDQVDLLVRQALWDQPDCAQAWAAWAFVQCHLQHDPERARDSVLHALDLSPSQVMAWTYRTTIDSLLGDTRSAYEAGQHALRLAPLGPLRYYQCCLAGHAALFDGRVQEAKQLLETSCALNPGHSPTLRMLVVAHHDLGNEARAREVMAQLRMLEPDLTVERYLSRSPGGHAERASFAQVVAAVGLPRS